MTKSSGGKGFQGISDLELEVMKALWEDGPGAPGELRERLAARGVGRAYTTVQTLLHRLLAKGYVGRRSAGGARVYDARLSRDDLLARHMDELARRVCGGLASPLVSSLVRSGRLSGAELRKVRALLDEARGRRGPASRKTRGRPER